LVKFSSPDVRKREQAGWWTGQIVEGRTVKVRVDEELCMASQSCIALAPKVFQIDWVKRKSSFSAAPIEVKDANGADNETIFLAAQSCPFPAIVLEDADTGERLYP
jgi:ferredoxin